MANKSGVHEGLKYLLIFREPTGLKMYTSSNGLSWGSSSILSNGVISNDFTSTDGNNFPLVASYPFFGSSARDAFKDCSTVGRQFSVFFIAQDAASNMGFNEQKLYRVQVRLRDNAVFTNSISSSVTN